MQIILNGAPAEVLDEITLTHLIDHLGLSNRRLAVEVNHQLVPRSRFADHRLSPDDRVEIIHAVGGG